MHTPFQGEGEKTDLLRTQIIYGNNMLTAACLL